MSAYTVTFVAVVVGLAALGVLAWSVRQYRAARRRSSFYAALARTRDRDLDRILAAVRGFEDSRARHRSVMPDPDSWGNG